MYKIYYTRRAGPKGGPTLRKEPGTAVLLWAWCGDGWYHGHEMWDKGKKLQLLLCLLLCFGAAAAS